jgi:hypothetical protein
MHISEDSDNGAHGGTTQHTRQPREPPSFFIMSKHFNPLQKQRIKGSIKEDMNFIRDGSFQNSAITLSAGAHKTACHVAREES